MSSEVYADRVQSLAGFLSFVEKHCEQFDHVLFRGQRQHWTLLPKLACLRIRDELDVLAAETKMLASFKSRAVALSSIQHRRQSGIGFLSYNIMVWQYGCWIGPPTRSRHCGSPLKDLRSKERRRSDGYSLMRKRTLWRIPVPLAPSTWIVLAYSNQGMLPDE